jgi:UDP-N-acetylmuramyl pentapeptide phosphotransferase/UDP-N-acetylglucosamine-1-phosphate transferase
VRATGAGSAVGLATSSNPHLPTLAVALGSAGGFAAGLLDDLFTLRPVTKLTGLVVLASLTLAGGLRLDWTDSLTADSLLTVPGLVGLANAFSLLDNMDGARAGAGAIAYGAGDAGEILAHELLNNRAHHCRPAFRGASQPRVRL